MRTSWTLERTINIDAPLEEEVGDDLALAFDFGGDVRAPWFPSRGTLAY
jgi:hypothetical protein